MKGLELSKGYYEEYGKPMLEKFPDLIPFLAVGSVGSGSDRYGFDDEISQDHDFEPGFCIFLPSENIVDRRQEFLLERAYAKLSKEYKGIKRQSLSPVGGNRNGVKRTADFYQAAIGVKDGNLSTYEWLHVPDYALFEATDGEVFVDNYGEFTEIRDRLKKMPEDVRLKRLAGNLFLMAQSGQYNFARCLSHGEHEAAQLALNEFVTSAVKVWFLLQNKYAPYYKWCFKALKGLDGGTELSQKLSVLLFGDNKEPGIAIRKSAVIEEVAALVIERLNNLQLTKAVCGDLIKHAYSLNDKIADGVLRNAHVLEGV